MTQDIKEFKQELNILFDQLIDYYHLDGDSKFELVERQYEQDGFKVSIPHEVRFSKFGRFIEVIDLTKELKIDIGSIESRLIRAMKYLDAYEYLHTYAKYHDLEIEFYGRHVTLFTEDCKEIEIQQIAEDRYSVSGHYILSDDARLVRYKLDSLLSFRLCDALPSHASIKSAISSEEIYAQGFFELEKAIADTRRHLDYASKRYLKMELIERKENDNEII